MESQSSRSLTPNKLQQQVTVLIEHNSINTGLNLSIMDDPTDENYVFISQEIYISSNSNTLDMFIFWLMLAAA